MRSGMLLKNIISFSSGSAFGQLMRVVQEFVTRILLPPEIMGLWNFVMVIRQFSAVFDFGVTTAVRRNIALFHGAAKWAEIRAYARTSVFLQIIQQSVIAVGVIIYALIFAGDDGSERFALYFAAEPRYAR